MHNHMPHIHACMCTGTRTHTHTHARTHTHTPGPVVPDTGDVVEVEVGEGAIVRLIPVTRDIDWHKFNLSLTVVVKELLIRFS